MVEILAIGSRRHFDGKPNICCPEYDVFAGLDVDKKSIAATFSSHQGFIRFVSMPYKVEDLLNHVRTTLRIRRWPLPMRLDPRDTGCMMGRRLKGIRA
jgi:hypothetical protein